MRCLILLTVSMFFMACGTRNAEIVDEQFIEAFRNPPNEYRIVQYGIPDSARVELSQQYGIGGAMAFYYNTLRDPSHPRYNDPSTIRKTLETARQAGLQVWLADDYGYPSGMAGGKVVAANPNYEVRGLLQLSVDGEGMRTVGMDIPEDTERIYAAVIYPVKDGKPDYSNGQPVPLSSDRQVSTTGLDGSWRLSVFVLKVRDNDSQGQQTIQQFGHTGRYSDLMNADAMKTFIELMHEQIAREAGDLIPFVEGFYTNEPNLMQLVWDSSDRSERPYAFISWNEQLPALFSEMHGYELLPLLGALYEGDDPEERRIRVHFQQTVAELLTESFARQIARWCESKGILSSGHFLLNEYLSMHVACYGDLMKFASEFHVPGLDMGIPNLDRVESFPYQQAKFFSSVAAWKQRDKVICLPDPIIAGGGRRRLSPDVKLVRNIVNMTSLYGANQMSAYLALDRRSDDQGVVAAGYTPEEYTALNEYIGRISLLLRGARIETNVALYYPITMFQADYKPSNVLWPNTVAKHKERQLAWDNTEKTLLDAGIDYMIIHPEALKEAKIYKGSLTMGAGSFRYLIMPQIEILSKPELEKINQFENAGGKVIWVDTKPVMGLYPDEDMDIQQGLSDKMVVAASSIPPLISQPFDETFQLMIEFENQPISLARFRKDGRCVYFIVNRSEHQASFRIEKTNRLVVHSLDPFTGNIDHMDLPSELSLKGFGSVLLMHKE